MSNITLGQARALRALLAWHKDIDIEGVDGFAKYAYPHQYAWPNNKTQNGRQTASRTVLEALRNAKLVADQPYENRQFYTATPPVGITQAGVDAVNAFKFPAEAEGFQFEALPVLVDIRTGETWQHSGEPGRVIGNALYSARQLRGDGKPKRGSYSERTGVRLSRNPYGFGSTARGLMPIDKTRELIAASIRRRIKAAQEEALAAEEALFDLYNSNVQAGQEGVATNG